MLIRTQPRSSASTAARLVQSLESLSVRPDVPITSYGDRDSDIKQLAELVGQARQLDGVIINPQHKDVGKKVKVAGIPTRVVRSIKDSLMDEKPTP